MSGFERYGVTPETLVLTSKGHIPIGKLENQEVSIWDGTRFVATMVAKVAESVPILRVKLTTGTEVTCSENHVFYEQPTPFAEPVFRVEARNLAPGMRLVKSPGFPVIEFGDRVFPEAYTHGFYVGAERLKRRRLVVARSIVYGYRRPCLDELKLNNDLTDKVNLTFPEYLPEDFALPLDSGYSLATRLEWLSGLCDSGFYKRKVKPKPIWHHFSDNPFFLRDLKLLTQTLGQDARVVPNEDRTRLKYSYRLSGKAFQEMYALGIKTFYIPKPETIEYKRRGIETPKVVDVESDFRTSDVFNFIETPNQTAVFEGVFTASN
jgi:hypothetical protein